MPDSHVIIEDESGKKELRDRLMSIMDEAISNSHDLDDYAEELAHYADSIIEGIGVNAIIEHGDFVTFTCAYSKSER